MKATTADSNGLVMSAAAIIRASRSRATSARPIIHALMAAQAKGATVPPGYCADARALENLEPRCEMLLDAGEVTLPGTCKHENAMRDRETSGTALAKGKFKCLVGKRIGGREVARTMEAVTHLPATPRKS